MPHQQGRIVFPLPQRGHADGKRIQPVIQIFAEGSLGESVPRSRFVAAIKRVFTSPSLPSMVSMDGAGSSSAPGALDAAFGLGRVGRDLLDAELFERAAELGGSLLTGELFGESPVGSLRWKME